MVNNTQLSKILADQILAKISNQLIVNKQYNTIYQSSFGEYEIANYKGELLIEFDTQKPGYGVYYGFKIEKEPDITDIDISNINKLFAPIMQHIEFVLQKATYLTDGVYDKKYYWAFWLRCNDFDIDSAKKHMEIIQDYFNQLTISKYNVVKL